MNRMQARSVNLIYRDNGAGLTRDMQLLRGILREAGHDVTVTQTSHRGRLSNRLRRLHARVRRLVRGWLRGEANARYDVNLMLEDVHPELLGQARRNVLIPNPEWFREEWKSWLPRFDRVFAKTEHARRLFAQLGCATTYIGFTCGDRRVAGAAPRDDFFHGAGRSSNKGTLPLLDLWTKHPAWPMLTVAWRCKEADRSAPANVTLVRGFLADEELRRLQNAHVFHLCPSQTEGYGHSLAESLSLSAVVITLDREPMNELVSPERGVLVAARDAGRQHLATLYEADPAAMAAAIERCLRMSAEERQRLGAAARQWYEENDRAFRQRLLHALADVA